MKLWTEDNVGEEKRKGGGNWTEADGRGLFSATALVWRLQPPGTLGVGATSPCSAPGLLGLAVWGPFPRCWRATGESQAARI